MIIDADTHISPVKGMDFSPVEELIKSMEKSNVDKAITWLKPPYLREIDESNQYIYETTKAYPDKIIGFGWADPNLGVSKAKDMVKKCVYEYGFYGVKLNGAQNSFFIDDPAMSLPVIEEIAKTGSVLAFHVGADAYEYTHPFRVAKIAKLYPEMRILVIHMGGAGIPNLSNAVIEFAKDNPNLTLIGSAIRYIDILKAVKELGASRVCFGSDTPFNLMHVEVAAYNALLDGEVSADDKSLIIGKNIVRLLKLT